MKVNLVSSFTRVLKEQFARGECDIILTTEESLDPGGETLVRTAAGLGRCAGRQSPGSSGPLRLAFEHNCIFRPGVQAALDAAGIAWEMAVESRKHAGDRGERQRRPCGAYRARGMRGAVSGADRRMAGRCPSWPRKRINLYVADPAHSPVVEVLAGLIRRAYAMRRECARTAPEGRAESRPQRSPPPCRWPCGCAAGRAPSASASSGSDVADMGVQAALGMPAQQRGEAVGQRLRGEGQIAAPVEADAPSGS